MDVELPRKYMLGGSFRAGAMDKSILSERNSHEIHVNSLGSPLHFR